MATLRVIVSGLVEKVTLGPPNVKGMLSKMFPRPNPQRSEARVLKTAKALPATSAEDSQGSVADIPDA